MKKLKLDEKIAIISYIVGEYHLAQLDLYADASRFPTSKDKTYDPQSYLISDALGLNFQKDVYDNKEYERLCSNHTGSSEVHAYIKSKGGFWHIGDTLSDVVATHCMNARNNNLTITEDIVEVIYNELNEVFSGFLKVIKTKDSHKYVQAPVTYNGVQLYQKVEQ